MTRAHRRLGVVLSARSQLGSAFGCGGPGEGPDLVPALLTSESRLSGPDSNQRPSGKQPFATRRHSALFNRLARLFSLIAAQFKRAANVPARVVEFLGTWGFYGQTRGPLTS